MSTSISENEEGYGTVIGPRAVRLERILPGPIERVWAYLTEPDKRAKWMAAGSMADYVGGPVDVTFDNSKTSVQALIKATANAGFPATVKQP